MPVKTQISIRGATYQQVKEFCDKQGIHVTDLINSMCKNFFNGKIKRPDYRTIRF